MPHLPKSSFVLLMMGIAHTAALAPAHAAPPESGVIPWHPTTAELAAHPLAAEAAALPVEPRTAKLLAELAALGSPPDLDQILTAALGPAEIGRTLWRVREGAVTMKVEGDGVAVLKATSRTEDPNAPPLSEAPAGDILGLVGTSCVDALQTLGRPSGILPDHQTFEWWWTHTRGQSVHFAVKCSDTGVHHVRIHWRQGPPISPYTTRAEPDAPAGKGIWVFMQRGLQPGRAKATDPTRFWPVPFGASTRVLFQQLGNPTASVPDGWVWNDTVRFENVGDGDRRHMTLGFHAGAFLRWRGLRSELADMIGESPERLKTLLGPPSETNAEEHRWTWLHTNGDLLHIVAVVRGDDNRWTHALRFKHHRAGGQASCRGLVPAAPIDPPSEQARRARPVLNMLGADRPATLVLPFGFGLTTRHADVEAVLGPALDCKPDRMSYPDLMMRFDIDGRLEAMDMSWAAAVKWRERFPKDPVLNLMAGPPEAATAEAGARIFGPGIGTGRHRLYTYESGPWLVSVSLLEDAAQLSVLVRRGPDFGGLVAGLRWAQLPADVARLFGTDEDSPIAASDDVLGYRSLTMQSDTARVLAARRVDGSAAQLVGASWNELVRHFGKPMAVRIEGGALVFTWAHEAGDIFGRELTATCPGMTPMCNKLVLRGRAAPPEDFEPDGF